MRAMNPVTADVEASKVASGAEGLSSPAGILHASRNREPAFFSQRLA